MRHAPRAVRRLSRGDRLEALGKAWKTGYRMPGDGFGPESAWERVRGLAGSAKRLNLAHAFEASSTSRTCRLWPKCSPVETEILSRACGALAGHTVILPGGGRDYDRRSDALARRPAGPLLAPSTLRQRRDDRPARIRRLPRESGTPRQPTPLSSAAGSPRRTAASSPTTAGSGRSTTTPTSSATSNTSSTCAGC